MTKEILDYHKLRLEINKHVCGDVIAASLEHIDYVNTRIRAIICSDVHGLIYGEASTSNHVSTCDLSASSTISYTADIGRTWRTTNITEETACSLILPILCNSEHAKATMLKAKKLGYKTLSEKIAFIATSMAADELESVLDSLINMFNDATKILNGVKT